ncbi:MAG: fibronectin type III domain-containing protein, partial [Clostridia bacterium]|nr:fibronectin type III domain-containing protein [Clostridia bacterium]
YTNACDKTCNVCSATRTISHSYKTTTTKATLTANGRVKTACTVCGYVKTNKVVYYPKTFTLSATSLTYNGKVRTPTVTIKDSAGNVLKKDTDYTVTYASGRKNIGTYKVTVTMKGNYSGTKTLTFKINPIKISSCTVKLSATSLTYNGNVRTPTVTVTNQYGTKLTKDKHYTVTYASGRKNVGTYKVSVKMIGNYTGTKTLTFKINPIDISKCTVKLSYISYTYNGSVKTPVVTVTNQYGTKLTKDKHYTVTYASGRKLVGTYKVTVKMIGNYTGTKTLTFKINPPKTTVASLKAGTKSITVNLTKKTTQVTGYQIQYSTNKDFTNAKTKTLTSSSTVKTTLTGLTAGKTYYVRVRTYKTVNNVKYYSGWSQYKYVKTK